MKGFKRGYCKYCYKRVRLIIKREENLITCAECDYGLAPLNNAETFSSFNKWMKHITRKFLLHKI